MPREINDRIDALFVEGPDDGALVNALVKQFTGIDLAREPYRVVKARHDGGGDTWAVRQFKKRIEEGRRQARIGLEARIGLIVDRDDATNDTKADHAAEYEPRHVRKAALKVRSVWRDASAAGGYGHLVRNLPLTQTPACDAFIAWFGRCF